MPKKTAKKKVSGGSRLNRTQTVTIRLDPKTRYFVDLAARKQRKTTSSYIEWAIENSFTTSLWDDTFELWDVDEPDRFVKLALKYPYLLTYEEEILWKLIKENGYLWKGRYNAQSEWSWTVQNQSFIYKRLRENWETFKAVASGDEDEDQLPTWEEKKQADPPSFDDEDIPF